MAARWLVLFPGAAQASMTWEPAAGPRRKAGRQLACERANPRERCGQQAPPAPPRGTADAAGWQAATATEGQVHRHHPPPEASARPTAPHSSPLPVPSSRGVWGGYSSVQSNSSRTYRLRKQSHRGTPQLQAAFTIFAETSSAAAKPAQAQPSAWRKGPTLHPRRWFSRPCSLLLPSSPTLSCRIMCPEVYSRLSWKSVCGGKASSSGRCRSSKNFFPERALSSSTLPTRHREGEHPVLLHRAHTRAQAENPLRPAAPLHFGTRQRPERQKARVGSDGDPSLDTVSTSNPPVHRTSSQAPAAR